MHSEWTVKKRDLSLFVVLCFSRRGFKPSANNDCYRSEFAVCAAYEIRLEDNKHQLHSFIVQCFGVMCALLQAMLSQGAAEALFEEASALGLSMGSTWEEDAQQCEVRTQTT